MAESTLSLKYDDANDATISIRQIVGRYMGVFREDGTISVANEAKLEDAIQSGYRQAEYPPVLPGETESHSWSHLEPTTSLVVSAAVDGMLANIPSRTGANYIFESAAGVFVSTMVGSEIRMTDTGALYRILSFISVTRVTAAGTGSVAFDNTFDSLLLDASLFALLGLTTTITATTAKFSSDMVGDEIVFGSNSYTITSYVSTSVVEVEGDASAESGTFTVERTINLLQDSNGDVSDSALKNPGGTGAAIVILNSPSLRDDMDTTEEADTIKFPVSGNTYSSIGIVSNQVMRVFAAPSNFEAVNADDTQLTVRRELTASTTVSNVRSQLVFEDQIFDESIIGQQIRFDATGNAYTISAVFIDAGDSFGRLLEVNGIADQETGRAKVVQAVGTITGPVVFSGSRTTLTITETNFLAVHVGMTLTFATSGKSYTIGVFTSTTVIKIIGDAGGEKAADEVFITGATDLSSGDAFTVTNTGDDYELPDDVGGIEGDFTFGEDEGWTPIPQVGEGKIRALRQTSRNGRPQAVAIRPIRATDTANESTRYELMIWPTPDNTYTLSYKYRAIPQKLTEGNPFPLGGMRHGETVLASCLAVAELRLNDEKGIHWATFIERLTADVRQDREAIVPETLGYNANQSEGRGLIRGRADVRSHTVTVQGVTPT